MDEAEAHWSMADEVLRRVVAEEVEDGVERDWTRDPDRPEAPQVLLTSDGCHAGLRVSGEWCDLSILDSRLGRTEFFGGPEELGEALRVLARIAAAYLRGEGRWNRERGLLLVRDVLTVSTPDAHWRLWRGLLGSQSSDGRGRPPA